MGLRNTLAPLLYPCCHLLCYYFGSLLEWRIGFGVMGTELFGVTLAVQGFVRCDAGSQWLVIVPKSNNRFVEQNPMKTVQPCAYKGTAWYSMW
jgi:hypothetical protein